MHQCAGVELGASCARGVRCINVWELGASMCWGELGLVAINVLGGS